MDYFEELLQLLKTERDEDMQSYLKLMQNTSVAERRAAGMSWYPVAIRGTEPTRGDYISVEVERTTHQDVDHQFRFGATAALFSNHDPQQSRVEGTVTYQSGNRLKITLRTEELPDWSRDGKLGIDLLFDENSYDEMQKALKQADALAQDTKAGHLVKVLTGQEQLRFVNTQIDVKLPQLNHSQQAAVNAICSARDVAIVHGPPGTGKTTTLVQAIKALYNKDRQAILVTAPSNTAVDLLTEKLASEGLNVLRIGNPARVSDKLMALTLDGKMATHPYMKDAKALKKQAAEYKNMAHKYKRNFGKAEREQRKALFNEAHKIMGEVGKTEQYIINDLVAKAQVITATLVGANHYTIRDIKFNTAVIDEAGQALEPACWIPILKANKLIIAGDHQQLPPTIKSAQAGRGGLATTLLEKCVRLYPEAVTLLDTQYRMHQNIMSFSSQEFYNNQLHAHPSVANHLLFDADLPLTFIDTAGCGFDEKPEGTSITNPDEAAFLFKHLDLLTKDLSKHYTPENFPSVAIISPYKEQVQIMQALVEETAQLHPYRYHISVNTIDSFQGQERDVVYISLTRSNNECLIGFLADTRRMNVAMTRARKKLIVIGDSATLAQSSFYTDFISHAEQAGGYKSAWDFL